MTRLTPVSLAARRIFKVPSVLTEWLVNGSSIDRWTEGMAARWKTTCTPAIAFRQIVKSRMSPSMISTGDGSPSTIRFARFPVTKLSRTRTP